MASAADAIVVGGGVMGLAAARELRRRGLGHVLLLERTTPGQAASWASAGIVGAATGDPAAPTADLRRLSLRLWPTFAAAAREESGLDPEYRASGILQVARDDAELASVRHDLESGAAAGGHLLASAGEVSDVEPAIGPAVRGAVWQPGGSVDNRRLTRALEIAARRSGVEVRTGVEVRAVAASGRRVAGVRVSHDGLLPAGLVVIAAGAWSGAIEGCRPLPPVVPQRGQILALDGALVGLRRVLMTRTDPYLVPRVDGRIVVGATRELVGWDGRLTAGGVAWLLQSAVEVLPALGACAVQELWTGFRPLSADGLPLIGPGELDGLFFLTGHGPSGISPLPASISLLVAHIFGEPLPVPSQPFSPSRFSTPARDLPPHGPAGSRASARAAPGVA